VRKVAALGDLAYVRAHGLCLLVVAMVLAYPTGRRVCRETRHAEEIAGFLAAPLRREPDMTT